MPCKTLLLAASLTMCGFTAVAVEPKKPDCAPFALPDMTLTWVAQDVVHNGMPMQIRRFESADNVQTILARYRSEWKATAQSPEDAIEYPIGGDLVIAKLRDLCFYTVQVRRHGRSGSTGTLAVSQIQTGLQVHELGNNFPMMSGSLVAADITHRDPGKKARTLMFMNQFSTNANADFYRRVIGDDGWHIISDHLVPFKGGSGNGYALTFKRGFHETSMVISRTEGGSSVLVNLVDKP